MNLSDVGAASLRALDSIDGSVPTAIMAAQLLLPPQTTQSLESSLSYAYFAQ